ncbi:hypothetical protein SAMN05421504_101917 [Amycolatopsis xylanica]|uniref:Short chain dehydrogenase n=1 Tax=Amycolatopsis xylanica TaxID=589385 RepID=A0A1H2UM81_9PSEU|nr:hypothetical protein [Amycolatopsis xylanica]SDW56614.1 hypothetical protein SAMN05421504_101917 [Amycolatopsis xylanica]
MDQAVTLINVFTVPPEESALFLERWNDNAESRFTSFPATRSGLGYDMPEAKMVALVSGSSRGIGAATAREPAARGYQTSWEQAGSAVHRVR